MDSDLRDRSSKGGRRKFLRQFGVTAAATAAAAGLIDVAGVQPAFASDNKRKPSGVQRPPRKRVRGVEDAEAERFLRVNCSLAPNMCGEPCAHNLWCHVCSNSSNGAQAYFCIGGYSSFYLSGTG
jgi:hypothetical protein